MDFLRQQGCCAWLGRGPGKRSERRSRLKAICPNAMRSFWKVAAFRLTESIRIQSGRRALRCFQNELHHFTILNLKWYYSLEAKYSNSKVESRMWERHWVSRGPWSSRERESLPQIEKYG